MSDPDDDRTAPGGVVTIAAALRPSEANAARDALRQALEAARTAGTPLAVEIEGEQPWPCAVQLLAAAEKSARAAGVPFAPGAAADAARLPLPPGDPQQQRPQ